MRIADYLCQHAERVPECLATWAPGEAPSLDELLACRAVYYPGALSDGHPFRLFGASHAAHVFVYVDYGLSRQQFADHLAPTSRTRLKGYQMTELFDLSEAELAPAGWRQRLHLDPADSAKVAHASRDWIPSWMESMNVVPYATLAILDREPDFGDSHGPARLALLQIGGDGFLAFDALFCRPGRREPFAIVLQDHGFGGNYGKFGRGGLLERIAQRAGRFPEWMLLGASTQPWSGYERVPECQPSIGGMHRVERVLMRRT